MQEEEIPTCHTSHAKDVAYETDAGTWKVTRHNKIYPTQEEAYKALLDLRRWDIDL